MKTSTTFATFEDYARDRAAHGLQAMPRTVWQALKSGTPGRALAFDRWLDTFISEKGIDADENLEVEGPSGLNVMPVGVLLDAMRAAPAHEQEAIKTMMVRLDFANAPIRPYLAHLAKAIAL